MVVDALVVQRLDFEPRDPSITYQVAGHIPYDVLNKDGVDDEAAEHLHQHVTGEDRNEQAQPEAERPDEEADQLDREQEQLHVPRHARRQEQREEVQAMFGEADDQNDRETENGEHAGDRKVAGGGERVKPGDNPERQNAKKVRDQDEAE